MYGGIFATVYKKSNICADCTVVVLKIVVGYKCMGNESKIDTDMTIGYRVVGDSDVGYAIICLMWYSYASRGIVDDEVVMDVCVVGMY